MATQQNKYTRPIVRVDNKTGEIVRFPSIKLAQASIGVKSISLYLLTNKPLKGYRFYYAEEWDGDN